MIFQEMLLSYCYVKLVSKNKEEINKTRFLATQARDEAPHYQHTQIGYNYRMSNITAGIGRGQLEILDHHVNLRRSHCLAYKKAFSQFDFIDFQPELKDTRSNKWLSCITFIENAPNHLDREIIRLKLEEYNIESRPLWKPMHLQPVFSQYPYYGDGLSERLFDKGLCLPSGSNMSLKDRDEVIDLVSELLNSLVPKIN